MMGTSFQPHPNKVCGHKTQHLLIGVIPSHSSLNAMVLLLSVGVVFYVRTLYLDVVEKMFPSLGGGSYGWMIAIGILLFVAVSFLNIVAIRRKVTSIWMRKS